MVFSSTVFLFIFLPITLVGYYLIQPSFRNVFLLIMSLLFYAAGEPKFVFVMMASILANYIAGRVIGSFLDALLFIRRILLAIAVVLNLGLLFYWKYYDFAVSNINILLRLSLPLRHIVLPIGISFFTFQGMSYVLDVYLGKAQVQKNLLHVALYIALFPQLIAGPIVRYTDISAQIMNRKETLLDFAQGIQRFSVGLAKKVVLSNSFALLADQAFGTDPVQLGMGLAWLGALAYTMQIYFDFSGYSDMAIGLGRMFGFHFLENFNYPYIAGSVSNFWRRWHISLSSWFRDYVYIPLGGNRKGNVYLHLLTVFFLTGLWHGASWNFVVWGMWHGAFLIVERIFRNKKVPKIPYVVKLCYTMLEVVIGWVFFRAENLTVAAKYIKCMFGFSNFGQSNGWGIFYFHDFLFTFLIAAVACTPVIPKIREFADIYIIPNRLREVMAPVLCSVLLLGSIGFLSVTRYNPFIYFNF